MTEKKTIQNISIDAQELSKKLMAMTHGDFISYSDLSAIIGRDVQTSGYPAMMTARRKALTESGLVFSPVIDHGLKCLTEEEVAMSGLTGLSRIRRIASREKKKLHLGIKNFDSLTNDAKIQHNTFASIYGAFMSMTTGKATRLIESTVTTENGAIPSARLLDIFKAV